MYNLLHYIHNNLFMSYIQVMSNIEIITLKNTWYNSKANILF